MGILWSTGNTDRTSNNFTQNPPPPPPLPPPPSYFYIPEPLPLPLPLPIPPPPLLPLPLDYFFPLPPTPYAPPCTTYATPPPPPPPPLLLPPQPHSFFYSVPNGYINYAEPVVGHVQYHPYFMTQLGWISPRPSSAAAANSTPPPPPPPPYVDHQATKKIRNHVNVHKDTLRLQLDDLNPDRYLVSFVFDAVYDGSITIIYFAKEVEKCRFVPLFPDSFEAVRIPFQKGAGQKFVQPSGTGIDRGFFESGDLSKSSPNGDVFPLVICAEVCLGTPSLDETPGDAMLDTHASFNMQTTQCVFERSDGGGASQIKVVRQILWIDGVRYELRELYGIVNSGATDFDDSDPEKECVICLIEPKDTAVLPCRHMCMCSECAKTLLLRTNKCPICRQSIEELIEIKMNNCHHQ